MRGQRILEITAPLIIQLLKGLKENYVGKYEVTKDALPWDATLVDVGLKENFTHNEAFPHSILLKIESGLYGQMHECGLIPYIPAPTLRTVPDEREQQLIDICFEVAMRAYACPRQFTNGGALAKWIADQLRKSGFDTVPVGMSWGVLKRSG